MSALAFASAFTALFAFRFRMKAWVIGAYFAGFALLEYVIQAFFLPEGAFPKEATLVLFGIAAIFTALRYAQKRFTGE